MFAHSSFESPGRPEKTGEAAAGLLAPRPLKVQAVEFIRPMRGASRPFLMRCDDGRLYVVKFLNNPQHVRVLANEMLAARLARRLGLPVPEPAHVEVSPRLIDGNPLLRFETAQGSVRCRPGVHYGSRFPDSSGAVLVVDFLPDRLLKRVGDFERIFAGAFVLDKWTCNCDGRQVIFHRAEDSPQREYSAALIDHGFCFNDGEWNFPDSPIRSLYPRRLVYDSVRGWRSFEPFLSAAENFDAGELEAGLAEIPAEWRGEQADLLPQLLERLYERRRRLRQLIIDAKNGAMRPFPNWK